MQASSTASGSDATDLRLLTPAGISSDPINTPGPSSLAVMALAMATIVRHCVRTRKTAN